MKGCALGFPHGVDAEVEVGKVVETGWRMSDNYRLTCQAPMLGMFSPSESGAARKKAAWKPRANKGPCCALSSPNPFPGVIASIVAQVLLN